jgi:spermidine/putrescine transport system permease protein
MLIAHTTFCLPYVILSVLPRRIELGKNLTEAAMDLGCTPLQSFFKVELPNLLPGILSGFVMAFTLSLDDFVISYFCSGTDFQTLPILIYSMTKKEVKPDIYALSTLMIIAILALLILSNLSRGREDGLSRFHSWRSRTRERMQERRESKGGAAK